MSLFTAFFLGVFQGITEFLPVSSSGHLVIAENLFHLPAEKFLAFDAALHGGTLVALVALFWKEILDFVRVIFFPRSSSLEAKKELGILFLATLPVGLIGFVFADFFESFRITKIVGFCFLISALFFWIAEKISAQQKKKKSLSVVSGLAAGTAQVFALLPGISRSGSVIAAVMMTRIPREVATRFAFLSGLPVIFAASGLQLFSIFQGKSDFPFSISETLVGVFSSALIGFFFARFLLDFFKNHSLRGFALYLLGTGILTMIFG